MTHPSYISEVIGERIFFLPMPFAKLIEEDEPTFTLLVSMTPKETRS
jgi:hypothetical protein